MGEKVVSINRSLALVLLRVRQILDGSYTRDSINNRHWIWLDIQHAPSLQACMILTPDLSILIIDRPRDSSVDEAGNVDLRS